MRTLTRNVRRTGFAALAMVLLPLPVLAVSQPAQAAQPAAPAGSTHHAPGVTPEAWAAGRAQYGPNVTASQAVQAFWTPERKRAAKPVEELPGYAAAVKRFEQHKPAAQAESGQPRSIPPSEGALGTPSTVPAAINPNLDPAHPTARTSGKVFIVLGGGLGFCSGTVVNSEGQNTVWTAGHCVHTGAGGVWVDNLMFAPAFDDDLANTEPWGEWTAVDLWTNTAWVTSSDFSEDMGVAILGTLNGNHIVGLLGGQGLTINQGQSVFENAFGYPVEPPFDGGNLFQCAGTSAPETAQTIFMPCDMTRGSSGGGWLFQWDGNWGFLNGINSRIDQIVGPTIMASPYFDDTALGLYNATRNQ